MTKLRVVAALLLVAWLAGCGGIGPGAAKSSYTPYSQEDAGLRSGGEGGGGGGSGM